MTATERVRELLDERGVEWEDGGEGLTIIPAQDGVPQAWTVNTWPSSKDTGDCLWVQNRHPLTPEQAVAATLGREDTYTREDVESAFVSGYSLGSLPVGSDPQWDENRQTVDEHMAELGWVRKATLGSCNCSNNCTNSERTGACLPHFWTHDGALHVELPKLPESISVRLPDQRDREVGSARVWQYTRDSGTCHDKGTFESWGLFTCSNCSIVIPLNAAKDAPEVGKIVPLKFCPNCGARVVGSTTNNVGAEADA